MKGVKKNKKISWWNCEVEKRPSFDEVSEVYDLPNGFESLDRDCIQQILILTDYLEAVRNIVGITRTRFIQQTMHTRFHWCLKNLQLSLLLINHPEWPDDVEINGHQMMVMKASGTYNHCFVVVEKGFEDGIMRISVKLWKKRKNFGLGFFTFTDDVPYCDYYDWKNFTCYFSKGSCYNNKYQYGNDKYKTGDVISCELNVVHRTARFFVNTTEQPLFYTDIPRPVKFYLSSQCVGDHFEVLSLARLSQPSPPSLSPKKSPQPTEWDYSDN